MLLNYSSSIYNKSEVEKWTNLIEQARSRSISTKSFFDHPLWSVIEDIISFIEPLLTNAPFWLRLAVKIFPPLKDFISKVIAIIESVKSVGILNFEPEVASKKEPNNKKK